MDAINGSVQVGLLLSTMVASLIILRNGHPRDEVSASGGRAISSIVSEIFILLAVGALIGTWNMSGTIPALVHYGIQLLEPRWFYMASAIIYAVVSLGIGSSWTTVGTIGVELVGIASLLGVSPAITAGTFSYIYAHLCGSRRHSISIGITSEMSSFHISFLYFQDIFKRDYF